MFLSVGIAVYNAEEYLDECLESVVSQDFADFEIVLVNDGSKDSSREKCRDWADKYPDKIRFFDCENQGSLVARRTCMKEAEGEYVYLMDADDYLLTKDAFSLIRRIVDESKADMVFFNYTTNVVQNEKHYSFSNGQIFVGESLSEIYEMFITTRDFNSLWNKVYSKNLVDFEADYTQYRNICNGTDSFQLTPILASAKRIVYLDKTLYYYRTVTGSVTHVFSPKLLYTLEEAHRRLEEFAIGKKEFVPDVERKLADRYLLSVASTVSKIRYVKDSKERMDYLQKVANESRFRERYEQADKKNLSRIKKIVLKLLYKKNYRLLSAILKLKG